MDIKTETYINAPVDQVWKVVGEQFPDVAHWASAVESSHGAASAQQPSGAPCGRRVCETSMGRFEETLVEFDAQAHALRYTAQGEKMPFFVRALSNSWRLRPEGPRTRVDIHMQVSLLPVFAQLMGPMMRKQMSQVLTSTLGELKYYVENGSVLEVAA